MLLLFGTFGGLRDLKHDRELAAALGDMVIAWSNAEQALVQVFHKLTNTSHAMATAAYYRIPTFEARTKTIRAMLSEWETDQYDPAEIQRAILKLNGLARTRNNWVHSTWLWQNGSGGTYICDYREEKDDPKRMRPVKAADVANHVEAVQLRAQAIWDLAEPRPKQPA